MGRSEGRAASLGSKLSLDVNAYNMVNASSTVPPSRGPHLSPEEFSPVRNSCILTSSIRPPRCDEQSASCGDLSHGHELFPQAA
jgi:hypothetical protein